MEYYSSKVHLHRPTANFGSPHSTMEVQSTLSRHICIDNAENIAQAVQDYGNIYGDISTMSGIGLHIIATATTILIAAIADKRSTDSSRELHAFQICVRGLTELEKTYLVARRVRRIIRLIVGLCHIDTDHVPTNGTQEVVKPRHEEPEHLFSTKLDHSEDAIAFNFPHDIPEVSSMAGEGPLWMEEFQVPSGYSQFDIMFNLNSY